MKVDRVVPVPAPDSSAVRPTPGPWKLDGDGAVAPADSSGVAWRCTEYERFCFLGRVFDVRAAKRLIDCARRSVLSVKVAQAATLLGVIRIDEELVGKADPNVPIILGTFSAEGEGDCYMPIDGWHRIKRAAADGLDSIPAVLLTADETRRVQRAGGAA